MGKASNKTWACPFYRWADRTTVHCEGGRIAFPDAATASSYADSYCAGGQDWKRCTIARSLREYYEGKEP